MSDVKYTSTFYVELKQAGVLRCSVEAAWAELKQHADRLGMTVHCEVGGELVVAEPGLGTKPHVVKSHMVLDDRRLQEEF
jgi:prophage tail gpP-like protein